MIQLRNELDNCPVSQRMRVVKHRLAELPEPPREAYTFMFFAGVDMKILQEEQWKRSERMFGLVFGGATILFLAVVAIAVPDPKPFARFVFRLIAALGAGAVGAFLPGSLSTSLKRPSFAIRASGAIALAVIVYLINPPSL